MENRLPPKPIVIVGFMGSGKTTIGRHLAERMGVPFHDSDREIEQAAGLSIPEIFAERGEAAFRVIERATIARLLEEGAGVLSVGGGAYLDHRTRVAVNDRATAIWLDPPFDVILERVNRSSKRPLAMGRSPAELRRLWEQRQGSYAKAHLRVVTSDTDPEEAVDRILELLSH